MRLPHWRKSVFIALACALILGTGITTALFNGLRVGAATPLRDLAAARGLLIGAAVDADALQNDSDYSRVLAQEFNALTPENVMKWDTIHPQQNTYTFGPGDTLTNFAGQHNMQVRGHALVWHQQNPDWVNNGSFNRDQAMQILRDHITTVVTHYKNSVNIWDVVNEAIDDNTGGLRSTVWSNSIGSDYIDLAFQWAHEANPNAKLFYNDYGGEGPQSKGNDIYNLVKGMKDRGVPIDGVGIQMHLDLSYAQGWKADILANMQRLANLGLEVQVTEMDVITQHINASDSEKLEKQANLYGDVLSDCLAVSRCTAFVMWGFTDKYSWIYNYVGPNDAPLIFDRQYQYKPAYNRLNDILSNGGGSNPTPTPTPGGGGGNNLALNRPATTSSYEGNLASYAASNAFDGNTGTRWSSDFYDYQWIRVDLGSVRTINRVLLNWEGAYAKTYRIEVSNDDNSWTSIYNTSNGDGGIDDLSNISGSGRYIRMYASLRATPWGYSLYEFEVYGS